MNAKAHLKTGKGGANVEIDAALAVVSAVTPPGCWYTQQEHAEVLGCSQAYIYQLQREAMKKLRRFFQRETNAELREAFRQMLALGTTARTCASRSAFLLERRAA